jgi:uncharacterized membrane protein HdeD (DUF308 family)
VTQTDAPPSELHRVTRTTLILTIVSGVSALLFGILVLVWPRTTLLVVAILFGLELIIVGATRIIGGATDSSAEGWHRALSITLGVLIVLAGIFCLRNPGLSLVTIIVVVAIGWLVDGIMNIALSVQKRPGERAGGIVMGVVFILGALAMLVFPSSALLTFVLLGGWILIAFGIVTIVAAIFGLRKLPKIA